MKNLRLGGWWRLWIVLSACWAIPVINLAITTAPKSEITPVKDVAELTLDQQKAIAIARARVRVAQAAHNPHEELNALRHLSELEVEAGNSRALEYAKWIVENEDKKGTHEFALIAEAYKDARNFSISATDSTKPSVKKTEDAALAASREKLLEAEQHKMRRHIRSMFLLWLMPSLGLLATGSAVGWVTRGFRKV